MVHFISLDIDSALDGMATETPDGRINFYKFHVIGGVLISIAYNQLYEGKYVLAVNEVVQSQFREIPALSMTDSFVAKAREIERGLFDKPHQIEPVFGMDLIEATEKFGVFADKSRGMVPLVLREIAKALTDGT